jgi:hypothetical protein
MYSKWLDRLNTARAWILGIALATAAVVWLVRH